MWALILQAYNTLRKNRVWPYNDNALGSENVNFLRWGVNIIHTKLQNNGDLNSSNVHFRRVPIKEAGWLNSVID